MSRYLSFGKTNDDIENFTSVLLLIIMGIATGRKTYRSGSTILHYQVFTYVFCPVDASLPMLFQTPLRRGILCAKYNVRYVVVLYKIQCEVCSSTVYQSIHGVVIINSTSLPRLIFICCNLCQLIKICLRWLSFVVANGG